MRGYRLVIYAGTLLTGMTGLVYQVVWQKHLSFVVGSEARSVALVVAIFLSGLAAGYRHWGTLTQRPFQRQRLLKLYGLIEIGIGVYAAVFPFYLQVIKLISYHGPAWLLTDIVVTILTLLLPTFLMGATIPLLVSVVPEQSHEVHLCHAKIYGINTLGACLGAFGASFLLIPRLGLSGTLYFGSLVNLVVGTIFVLNRLSHSTAKTEPIESIPNRFDARLLYLYTFTTGTITLSLEVLFVRVLNLTIGAGPHNFAIVVGVFIFGLGLGSLLLTNRLLSVAVLFRAIAFLVCYLMLLFHSIPYWPYWLSNARACLTDLPVNYAVYLFLVTGFLIVILLPFLLPLGFMLPLVYSLLPKDSIDYGKKCGWMYFYNTLGTAVGAIVLSYLLLHVLDLDWVFKISVGLLTLLSVYLFYRERRLRLSFGLLLLALLFFVGPGWDRSSHHLGLFAYQRLNDFNFQGVFQKPMLVPKVSFFEDGPDTTVSVGDFEREVRASPSGAGDPADMWLPSRALFNNGRSEGDTVLDYSTMTLAAVLPYLYAPERPQLEATVIGLGSGMTAGILGRAEGIRRVRVVEISPTVIRAAKLFDDASYGLSNNSKVEMVPTDGFKYLTRLKDRLDIVVSEPSVPWVVGVENLFTPEYYRLVHAVLTEDGIFMQWFPLYTVDASLFRTILKNLDAVFPHMRLYRISPIEMGILASKTALPLQARLERFEEAVIRETNAKLHLTDADQLALISIYDSPQLRFLISDGDFPPHTLDRPGLAYASNRIRFLNPRVNWDGFIDPRVMRLTGYSRFRGEAFADLRRKFPGGIPCTQPYSGAELFCKRFNELRQAQREFEGEGGETPWLKRLEAYDRLRQEGVQPKHAEFLSAATAHLIEPPRSVKQEAARTIESIILAYVKDGMWEEAKRDLTLLAGNGLIDPAYHARTVASVERSRAMYTEFADRYRRVANDTLADVRPE